MIVLVSCISSNSGIGMKNGELLFHIKEDLKNFQKLTRGQITVMGRKTFESIVDKNGKPLPNRINVVLTRNENYVPQHGELVFNSVEKILNHHETMNESDKKVCVIGGHDIYSLFLPHASEVILTHVNRHVEEAEVFYPMSLQQELNFVPVSESEEHYSEKYDAYYKFVKYRRTINSEEGEEHLKQEASEGV